MAGKQEVFTPPHHFFHCIFARVISPIIFRMFLKMLRVKQNDFCFFHVDAVFAFSLELVLY